MNEINDNTRKILQHIVQQLRSGFTGRIELECHQGGIRDARKIERIDVRGDTLTDTPPVV